MNFSQAKEGFKFTVKNHHECNLGKWIDENQDKKFVKSKEGRFKTTWVRNKQFSSRSSKSICTKVIINNL